MTSYNLKLLPFQELYALSGGSLSSQTPTIKMGQDEDIVIKKEGDFKVCLIGKKNLKKFTQFVHDVYSETFPKVGGSAPSKEDFEYMYRGDCQYASNSFFLAYKDSHDKIVASIRVTHRQRQLYQLPIEYLYGIDLDAFIEAYKLSDEDCWHVGRTAIATNELKQYGKAFTPDLRRLLAWTAWLTMQQSPAPYYVHESDGYILKILRKLFNWTVYKIGDGKMDMGTVSYPVYSPHRSLVKHLMKVNL